jgi:hypothetical protein
MGLTHIWGSEGLVASEPFAIIQVRWASQQTAVFPLGQLRETFPLGHLKGHQAQPL